MRNVVKKELIAVAKELVECLNEYDQFTYVVYYNWLNWEIVARKTMHQDEYTLGIGIWEQDFSQRNNMRMFYRALNTGMYTVKNYKTHTVDEVYRSLTKMLKHFCGSKENGRMKLRRKK